MKLTYTIAKGFEVVFGTYGVAVDTLSAGLAGDDQPAFLWFESGEIVETVAGAQDALRGVQSHAAVS